MPTAPKTAATLSRSMGVLAALAPALSWAADTPVPNKGDTAWMLTCTAFVLLMSVPALALGATLELRHTRRRPSPPRVTP